MIHWIQLYDGSTSCEDRWNSIRDTVVLPHYGRLGIHDPVDLLDPNSDPVISLPSGLSAWGDCALILNISYTVNGVKYYHSPAALAGRVLQHLNDSSKPSVFVALNEIGGSASSYTTIRDTANLIGAGYAWRWGTFIAYNLFNPGGDPSVAWPGIQAVLANKGRLLPEIYPSYVGYWNSSTSSAGRDNWFVTNFLGTAASGSSPATKLRWLKEQSDAMGYNPAKIHPILTMCDVMMRSLDEQKIRQFIDRVMYLMRTQSGWGATIMNGAGGGLGSYIWTLRDYNSSAGWTEASTNSRDSTFAGFWVWYCIDGKTTPHWTANVPDPNPVIPMPS